MSASTKLMESFAAWRQAARTLLVRTDVRRWKKVAKQAPPWDERNRTIARHIPPGSSVLDLGCGAQTLRRYLAAGCEYQPCDIIQTTPDVILCDFNGGMYPRLPRRYDYVVCSGILEYMRNPPEFMSAIAAYGSHIVLSYNVNDGRERVFQRMTKGWVNHLSSEELQALFSRCNLAGEVLQDHPDGQMIYHLQPRTSH